VTAFASIVLWLALERPEVVEVVQLGTTMGGGEARIVFRLFPIDTHSPRTTIVRSADGKSIEFKADKRDHLVKVPASYPEATMIRVDATPILLMLCHRLRPGVVGDDRPRRHAARPGPVTAQTGASPSLRIRTAQCLYDGWRLYGSKTAIVSWLHSA